MRTAPQQRIFSSHQYPVGAALGALALALAAGFAPGAGAAPIVHLGETVGPITNSTLVEYILLDEGDDGGGNTVPTLVTGDVTNDSSGEIPGDATHSAVGIYNGSEVAGALINRGSIGASDLAGYAIEIRDATVAGGIQNSGSLAGNAGGILIDALDLDITGGIVNTGSIDGGGEGIDLRGNSFSGGITNSGQITSALAGIFVDVDSPNGGAFTGGIVNSGNIQSDGNAGIRLLAGSLSGGLRNTGSINAPTDYGLDLAVGDVTDGLINEGTVTGGSGGLRVHGDSLGGGFLNTDAISSTDGDAVAFDLDSFTGGIANQGTLVSEARDGLVVNVADFADDVVNAGDIAAAGSGIVIGSGSVVAGAVINDTDATITGAGSLAAQTGIAVAGGARVSGGLTNRGSITARASLSVDTNAVSGAVENSGSLTGDIWLAGTDTNGDGLDLTNTGHIDLGVPMFASTLVSGDYRQTTTGSLGITLVSLSSYAGVAPVLILGYVALAGDLLLDLDADFDFVPWQRLTLIEVGGARDGQFGNYGDNDLVRGFGGRNGLYIDYTDEGDVALYTTPLPATWLLIGIGLFGWRRSGRRRGTSSS